MQECMKRYLCNGDKIRTWEWKEAEEDEDQDEEAKEEK